MADSDTTFCNRCVFYRGACTLNTTPQHDKCDDYRPLCLSCPFPTLFCATCSLHKQSGLRGRYLTIDKELGNHMYGCVWDTSPTKEMALYDA